MNAIAPEQLVLTPRRVFREVELGAPASIRKLCAQPKPGPRRAGARPIRWFPGTSPPVHLPMAGSDRTRRNRGGHKPGSIGTGKLSSKERTAFRLLEWELLHEGVRFGPGATFQDCQPGPCAHVSCSLNLYTDVIPPREGARCAGSDTPTARSKRTRAVICPACTKFFPALAPGDLSPGHAPAPFIKLNFPGKEIDEIPDTCALRVANRVAQKAADAAAAALEDGGDEPAEVSDKRDVLTLEEVGRLLNLTMGRADQIEKRAIRKIAAAAQAAGWGEAWRGILART